jgi:hypothetical protein
MPHYVQLDLKAPLPSKVLGFFSTEPLPGRLPIPYKDDFTKGPYVQVSDAVWDTRHTCHYWDGTKLVDDPTGHRQKIAALAEAMKNRTVLQRQAENLLDTTNQTVVLRCFEEAIPLPDEWKAYRATLRQIKDGAPYPLPTQPALPDFGG